MRRAASAVGFMRTEGLSRSHAKSELIELSRWFVRRLHGSFARTHALRAHPAGERDCLRLIIDDRRPCPAVFTLPAAANVAGDQACRRLYPADSLYAHSVSLQPH